jgi:hypothetical protein
MSICTRLVYFMLCLSVPLACILIILVAKLISHQITSTQLKITFQVNYINQHKHFRYFILFVSCCGFQNIPITSFSQLMLYMYTLFHTQITQLIIQCIFNLWCEHGSYQRNYNAQFLTHYFICSPTYLMSQNSLKVLTSF